MLMSSADVVQSGKPRTILTVQGMTSQKKRSYPHPGTAANFRHSAITSGAQPISIRGSHNQDVQLGKVAAGNVAKQIKELSEFEAPAVSLPSALLDVADDYATHLKLPSKSQTFHRVQQKMIGSAPRPCRQKFQCT